MEIGDEFSGSYYDVLGVGHHSSLQEIRRASRKLAMKWHPDRWTRRPSMFAQAKRRFQIIQEAYEVLSDDRKRDKRQEYSLEELQRMLMEMAQRKANRWNISSSAQRKWWCYRDCHVM